MENFTIELDKYTYEYNEGKQAIFRNGELWCQDNWPDYIILAMAMRIKELEEEIWGEDI